MVDAVVVACGVNAIEPTGGPQPGFSIRQADGQTETVARVIATEQPRARARR